MNKKSEIRIMIGEVAGTIGGIAGVMERYFKSLEPHVKLLRQQEKKLVKASYMIDEHLGDK